MFEKFSRRQFAGLAGLSALGLSAPGEAANHAPRPDGANFPPGFVWGTATSSYQVEGAVNEDGRGPSIWDTFTHRSGKIEDGSTGDRANDHYHRYKEDVRLIKELGAKAYRFSIAWPRVFPDGDGPPNPRGLDFYNRLVDELLANGIEPYATLYHWDLPQALQDRVGGWRSRDTSKAFGDYAGYVAQRLTDRVKNIFTLNEVGRFLPFGYALGVDAPGLTLPPAEVNQARHHVAVPRAGFQARRGLHQQLVADAVAKGATVICGGEKTSGPGFFYPPTVLSGVGLDADLMRTEIFGPVAAIIPFGNADRPDDPAADDEVLALANDTPWGLVGYLFSQDVDRCARLSAALETGMVGVNTGAVSNPAAPFGGVKESGLGREGGRVGIEEFLDMKYTATPIHRR